MTPFTSEPDVEVLMLVDCAQVLNGKLFLMGGGWESTYPQHLESPAVINCVVSIQIPWNCTNQDYSVILTLETPDGNELARVNGRFNQGRPNGAWIGESQRLIWTASLVCTFPKLGGYYVVARIEGSAASKRVGFRVLAA